MANVESKNKTQKKELLHKLKKEIDNLEKDINYPKIRNLKIGAKKNFKISLKIIKYVTPYILAVGILAGAGKLVGFGYPFYSGDTFKKDIEIMTEIDNFGNIRTERYADNGENDKNILRYYTKWELDENGVYSRKVKVYDIKKLTESDIKKLIDNPETKLSDILGEAISEIKETKNNLTEEELLQNSYLQARIFSKDENEYFIYKETTGDNIVYTIIWIVITILTEFGVHNMRRENLDKLEENIEKIKEQCYVDEQMLKRKLKIKRDNYNRLNG